MRVSALFNARLPPLSGIFFLRSRKIHLSCGAPAQQHTARLARRFVGIGLLLGMLAGCVNTVGSQPRSVNLAGFPPSFKDGYGDGCQSARALVGSRRDEKRFASDRQYASGWRDGFDACNRSKSRDN